MIYHDEPFHDYNILYVLPNFKSHPFKRPWKNCNKDRAFRVLVTSRFETWNGGTRMAGWFTIENATKMDDSGGTPIFWKPPCYFHDLPCFDWNKGVNKQHKRIYTTGFFSLHGDVYCYSFKRMLPLQHVELYTFRHCWSMSSPLHIPSGKLT